MKLSNYCDRIIRYSFYTLFFFVPLFFTSNTSELFELNKMWLTWGLTTIIVVAWISKMIAGRRIFIQRTPLDIPILLFLISQLVSTIFSLDSRISFWGYYSRFNGGFLSFLSYTALYYAFVSNDVAKELKRILFITLMGAIIVALWGLPSHFGYDPTCLMFRGTLDTSCWTEAFKPTIRIFSTLGQPAWMAAYLAVLLPLSMALWIYLFEKDKRAFTVPDFLNWKILGLLAVIVLFYFDLLFTDTRGGFLAFWVANGLFWATLFFLRIFPLKRFLTYVVLLNFFFVLGNFLIGTSISQLDRFSLREIQAKPQAVSTQTASTASPSAQAQSDIIDPGITDSGQIRLLVWKGAIDAWIANPLFGTGVETFAFAYYRFRPAAHNMTSEWDYLYNKAHNEYLNYLATTGAIGLGTQIAFLGLFLFFAIRYFARLRAHAKDHQQLFHVLIASSIPASFVSIIISNFFGFSVVIMNIFLYFLPLWFFLSSQTLPDKAFTLVFPSQLKRSGLNTYQWIGISGVTIVGLIFLYQLFVFWQADTKYALGYNYDRAGAYDTAYQYLSTAVQTRPSEPVFKDELSVNLATLASALFQNNNATTGAQLAQQALTLSNEVTANHPNNIVFWKSRVRVFYMLAQIDGKYYKDALNAILTAQKLAPTDAKISYNVGVLYGQNEQYNQAVKALSETVKLKPNYRDAYYARALFSRQLAEKAYGREKIQLQNKANADLTYILRHINPTDPEAKKTLESWGGL